MMDLTRKAYGIMLGATLGGVLLDHFSMAATMIGGMALLVTASLVVGGCERLKL